MTPTLRQPFLLVLALASVMPGCSRPPPAPPANPVPATPTAPVSSARFVDVAGQAGLNYRWSIAGTHPYNLLQTIGNGCAFLDYDGDHNLDILLVGPRLALYRGDGRGHFTDVTAATGLDQIHGNFLGCAVGDYDNDGYPDIYLCAYRGGVLLHNDHGRRFVDVTKTAGIAPQPWGTCAGFVDIDQSGRLSLYIGNYVVFGPDTHPQLCLVDGQLAACGPNAYKPEHGVLYRNVGGGKFEDVTTAWHVDSNSGRALGIATADFNGSGRQSIYLANDERPGDLFENAGGRFTNIGGSSGTAYDNAAKEHGGMGADWGDYDNDGRLDLAVATFYKEPKCVYHNDGDDLFTEESWNLGLADPTLPNVAFGLKWIDVDNRGWLDLLITNGYTQDNADVIHPDTHYRQPTQLFMNDHGTRFVDASSSLIGDAGRPIVGRGLAIGDFDNDGRMDALAVDSEGAPLLLHNETPAAGHWLEVDLTGTKSNRDGQGALLTATGEGHSWLQQCTTSGSYMSASDKRVHFGLSDVTKLDSLKVKWPSGHIDTFRDVAVDRVIAITEGKRGV